MSPAAAGTAAAGHTAAKRTAGEASAATAESTATASDNHHRQLFKEGQGADEVVPDMQ